MRTLKRPEGPVGTLISSTSPASIPGHAHLGAGIERGELLELGVEAERVGEQHAPVADEEETRGEEKDATDHEQANGGQSILCHQPSIRNAATT